MRSRLTALLVTLMLIATMFPISASASSLDAVSLSLDELSILQEDPYTAYDQKNAQKTSLTKQGPTTSAYSVDEVILSDLTQSFIHAYHESISTKDEVDLAAFYDLGTDNRVNDYTLNQAYIRFRMHTNRDVVDSSETISLITFDWNIAGRATQNDVVVVSALNSHYDTLDDGQTMQVNDQLHEITFTKIDGAYKVVRARQYNFDFAALIDHYNDRPEFAGNLKGFVECMIDFADNFDTMKASMPGEVQSEAQSEAPANRVTRAFYSYTSTMRTAAVNYAVQYSVNYSSSYPNHNDGNGNYDCAYFTSQCLLDSTGACFPNDRNGYTWFFNLNNTNDRSTSWAGAHAFRDYLYFNDTHATDKISNTPSLIECSALTLASPFLTDLILRIWHLDY